MAIKAATNTATGQQTTTIPNVPVQSAMHDASGNLTRPWLTFFQQAGVLPLALEINGTPNGSQALFNLVAGLNVTLTDDGAGDITIAATGGGVNAQTASYTAVAGDAGKIISITAAGATTTKLPAAPPSTAWSVFIENVGAGTLTVSPNGLKIDGATGSLTLTTNQGVYISTDGTNYFSVRGLAPAATGGTIGGASVKTASYTAVAGDSGILLVFNSTSALTLTLPAAAPNATWNLPVQNVGLGELTIARNGLTIDAATANLAVSQSQGVYISTDGTNYFTQRGGPLPGTTITDSIAGTTLTVNNTRTAGTCLALNGFYALTVIGSGVAVTAETTTGCAVAASATSGAAGQFLSSSGLNTCVTMSNTGNGADLGLGKLQFVGSATLPAAPSAGMQYYWTVAKNLVDDGAAVGSVAVAAGHGALVVFVGATWRTMC